MRRPVDVGVEHAHRRTFRGQRQREIHCRGRLAHAALAARDRDDVLDAGHELDAALHRMRDDSRSDGHRHAADARHRGHAPTIELAQRLVLALRGVAEREVDDDVAPSP